ncbi:MAG: mechanosensitive ion channel protein MscS [Robiginitomaculum sp.]|nr:MAG: mechanosensitive ion channel protein MscS [Robiginitomaculum sp.]
MNIAANASAYTDTAISVLMTAGPKFVFGIVVFFIGKWLAGRISNAIETLANKAPNADASLSRFFASLARNLILFFVAVAALTLIGVDTASFIGLIAGLGLASAFILQDSLSNLASGVMMMIFRPYVIGDEVEIEGQKGVVTSIELVATRMRTRDNVELIVQNSKVWGGIVRNHSAHEKRRLDMVFGISYDANIDIAIAAIVGVAQADDRVFKDPAPWAKVVNLGESSVDIELRIWATFKDIRNLKMEISQPVKAALDAAGIGIPYPHITKIRQHVKHSTARDGLARTQARHLATHAKLKKS